MTDWGSFFRGVRAWRPFVSGHVNYKAWRVKGGYPLFSASTRRRFWLQVWTPIWHEGRGPYVSIGIGLFAVGRGY